MYITGQTTGSRVLDSSCSPRQDFRKQGQISRQSLCLVIIFSVFFPNDLNFCQSSFNLSRNNLYIDVSTKFSDYNAEKYLIVGYGYASYMARK